MTDATPTMYGEKSALERFGDALSHYSNVFAAIGLITIMLVNGLNVGTRYFLGFAFPWADELMQFIMIALIFTGCVTITWRQLHIRIDLLLEIFTPRVRRVIDALTAIVSIAALLYIDKASFSIVDRLFEFEQRSLALEVPLWIPQFFVAAGFLLMAVIIALRVFISFASAKQH
jgi:TRAP-type C4-dicarboxylate transport system permease small subunit